MLADFVKAISGLAIESNSADRKVKILDIPGAPRWEKVLVKADGTTQSYVLPAEPRNLTLLTVAEIVPHIEMIRNQFAGNPSVWVSTGKVKIVHDDSKDSRREGSTEIPLQFSPLFELLLNWSKNPREFLHEHFLQMLRRKFRDAIPNLDALLQTLRKATFREGKNLVSEATRTRSSIGAEITRDLQLEASELPDMLQANVQAFADPAIQFGGIIRCLLEVDDDAKTWQLVPLAGECDKLLDDTLANVCSLLRNALPKDVPVVYGIP